MGFVKCAYLVLLLVLLSAAMWNTTSSVNAFPRHQFEENAGATSSRNIHAVSTGKGVHHIEDNYIGGRKMAVQRVAVAGASRTVRRSLTDKNENQNCGGDRVKLGSHVECSNQQSTTTGTSEFSEGVDKFVAFNEDYHAPRHHPPKNN